MQKKSKTWWIDFFLVCAVLLLAESARGVVIGTLSIYLESLGGDSFFLGIVVSAFSLGRLIASFSFGALADYWSTRSVLLLSTVGCMCGNLLFCTAGSLNSKYTLLFSRILTGFGTGMLSVARTHVSVTTPGDERTLWMSWLGIVQFVGFAITPVLGNIRVRQVDWGVLLINDYTFATLLLFGLECWVFVMLMFFMSKQSAGKAQDKDKEKQALQAAATQPLDVNGNDVDSDSQYHQLTDDKVDLHRQRESTEHGDEDEKAPYLDDEVAHEAVVSGGGGGGEVGWMPRSEPLTMSSRDLSVHRSQRMEARGAGVEALQQRDLIIYMEEHTPKGRETIFTPHHFVITGDPNSPSHPPQLIATSHPTPSLPSLAPITSPPSPPPTLSSRLTSFLSFISSSYVPLVFVFLNFSGRGILSVAEAFGTKIYNGITAPSGPSPSDLSASTFFLILGCMGLLVFLVMNRLVKWVEETNLLMVSFISMGIGFGVIVDFDDYDIDIVDFSAGMTLVWVIGTPISQTLSVSMLSKHFSQQQKAGLAPAHGVGFWMGLVTASGSVGRIIFPLVAGGLSIPSACLLASLAAFCTVPMILFPLKAYKPYLPWIKERLHCFIPDDHTAQPHRMLRTSSNGDRTEMLMLSGEGEGPVSGGGGEEGVGGGVLNSAPMLYFVSSQAQPGQGQTGGEAKEGTALLGSDKRRASIRNIASYDGQTPVNGARPDSRGTG